MIKFASYLIALLLMVVGMSSCTIFHSIKEDEVYLKKQKIELHNAGKDFRVSQEDLISLSKLKPNRRVLTARFNLGVYTLVPKKALARSEIRSGERCEKKNAKRIEKGKSTEPCTSLWMWMAYTIGEPPATFDSTKMNKSAQQMKLYLAKQSFFDAHVKPEVIYKNKGLVWWRKGKKVKVIYHVDPGPAFKIRNIDYESEDTGIAQRIDEIKERSTLHPNDLFNVDMLDKERDDISNYLNNRGYYDFTKDYIVFDADSTVGGHQIDTKLIIKGIQEVIPGKADSTKVVNHKRYYIGDVFINTVYNPRQPDFKPKDTLFYDNLYILSNGNLSLRPGLLSYTTSVISHEIYQKSKIDLTYKRFSQLGVFKSVTVQMTPRSQADSSGLNFVDIHVLLRPDKKQRIGFDPRVTNRSGNMGIYLNYLYRHKNLRGGAEQLDARILGGFEAAQTVVQTAGESSVGDQIQRNLRLNTFEIGPEITLKIPRLPFMAYARSGKRAEPSTLYSALLNYQIRPDYERILAQFNFSSSFVENPDKVRKITWDIAEFSIIKINKSQAFENFIERLRDRFLANSYSDHLILASRLSMTVNTQKNKFQRTYFYWRTLFEGAGNVLRGVFDLAGAKKDANGSFEIAGIRFAQYIKGETEFRFYYNLNTRNQFVTRSNIGIGYSYLNLPVLPFEKSFFSGGANGMRAWQARTLGPGSYRDYSAQKTFNNIGDIKLEFNFEYRFKLTQMFQMALFADAGNIWLVRPDANRPGADFKLDQFIGQVAIGGGMGLRLDFQFFLVRLDAGLQVKDPSMVKGERWFFEPKDVYNATIRSKQWSFSEYNFLRTRVFNLGIGFPF